MNTKRKLHTSQFLNLDFLQLLIFIILFNVIPQAIDAQINPGIQYIPLDDAEVAFCQPMLHYTPTQINNAVVANYSSSQILSCGKISFYFEDMLLSTGYGFDDQALGTNRKNILCKVANELQDIFNFGSVSSFNPVKIEVQQSYQSPQNPAPISWDATIAAAGPIFNNLQPGQSGFYGGQVFNKVNSNTTYTVSSSGFDGTIRVNFSPNLGVGYTLSENLNFVPSCGTDLYTVFLH